MTVEHDPNEIGSAAAWQNILNGCGYTVTLPIAITGELDSVTVEITKKFQKDVGLPPTGRIDTATWQAGLKHPKVSDWDANTPPVA